jgi:hypothetical protein
MTVIRRVGHTPNPGAHRAARRGGLAAVVAVLLVGTITIAAGASTTTSTTTGPEQPTLRVERVTLTPDGSTEAVVSVTGIAPGDTLTDGDVMVLEEGVRIPDVSVGPVASEPSGETPAAVLTVDISGSTAGEPLEAAIEAALELTTELEAAGVAVGLVAFGPDVSVLTRLDVRRHRALRSPPRGPRRAARHRRVLRRRGHHEQHRPDGGTWSGGGRRDPRDLGGA